MRYKVVGTVPALGYEPGEEFDADIDEAQEERLVARGAIERAGGSGGWAPVESTTDPVDDDDNDTGDTPEEGTEL